MNIEYHPDVERELAEIRDFYEGRSFGLGRDFIDEFERQVLHVATMPRSYMIVSKDIRRALMKRFPYVIYFRQVSRERIRITVIKHQRRHPAFGLDRN